VTSKTPTASGISRLLAAAGFTAEGLTLLSDEQIEELDGAVDRLRRLVAADKRRRRDELSSKFDVLGKDATATCLRHRRLVRWMAAPTWWYHADLNLGPAETRRCGAMWNAKAPIVIVRRDDVADSSLLAAKDGDPR